MEMKAEQSDNKSTEEEKLDKTKAFDGVFCSAKNLEEAVELRDIVAKNCPWPLIYELHDGGYEVGGLSKSGGRLNKESVKQIEADLKAHAKQKIKSDLNPDKYKETLLELMREEQEEEEDKETREFSNGT